MFQLKRYAECSSPFKITPMQLREELHRVIDHILKKNLFHQEHFLNELLAGRAQTIKIYAA